MLPILYLWNVMENMITIGNLSSMSQMGIDRYEVTSKGTEKPVLLLRSSHLRTDKNVWCFVN